MSHTFTLVSETVFLRAPGENRILHALDKLSKQGKQTQNKAPLKLLGTILLLSTVATFMFPFDPIAIAHALTSDNIRWHYFTCFRVSALPPETYPQRRSSRACQVVVDEFGTGTLAQTPRRRARTVGQLAVGAAEHFTVTNRHAGFTQEGSRRKLRRDFIGVSSAAVKGNLQRLRTDPWLGFGSTIF